MVSPYTLPLFLVLSSYTQLVTGQAAAAAAYAPVVTTCPTTPLVRNAGTGSSQALSPSESVYISSRQSLILPGAWEAYLSNVQASLPGQNATSLPQYVSDILSGASNTSGYPTLGIATSGGGYRAAIVGAGILNALDGRNASSAAVGTGGVLQAASYLAGLSGGSWLVTSLAQADFPTIPDLVFGSPQVRGVGDFGGWLANISLEIPTNDTLIDLAYTSDLLTEVSGKLLAGFPVSFTDIWARVLSRHFVNGTSAAAFFDSSLEHGAGITFSSIANVSTFRSFLQPFPIITADTLSPYENTSTYFDGIDIFVPLTNPIYEFNVYEMGSFDPTLAAFTPMQYLGSTNELFCVTGFDQASFMMATSASIFNTFNLTSLFSNSSLIEDFISLVEAHDQNGTLLEFIDTARVPNPFQGVAKETFIDTNATVLTLVDGGEDGLSVPLTPLLAKARGLDVLIAIDVDADTSDGWAAGSTLVATQQRSSYYPSAYPFPHVPASTDIFLAEGLALHPTFFGCNDSSTPFLIYFANGGPPLGQAPLTNTSADQVVYAADEIDGMLSQAFDIATQGIPLEVNGAPVKDLEWPACLACALVDRARSRAEIERAGVCVTCMERYCWS